MKSYRQNRTLRAFTLIEVMVAIAIFMMVIGVIYATWALVMRATQVGEEAAAQSQRERIALRTIEDSLMCIQSFQASQRYYSFNVTNDNDIPGLCFASRVPEIFPRNGKFGEFNLRRVQFSVDRVGGERDLLLRQVPVLMDMDEDEQKNPLILARNVKDFIIECWDTNQMDWVTEWNDTNTIPPMIRVALVLGGTTDNTGHSSTELSVVRAFSMPSQMMPAAVERGGAGGPAGGGPITLPTPVVAPPRR